tara:strand:+ start:1110 stop:1562 length:453 start_codon:yes stop_codon:yes gene_type:complete
MGYRSEVVMVIQMDDHEDEESVKNWHLFIAELKANPKCDIAMRELTKKDTQLDYGGIDMKNCSLYVSFNDVKWYDSDKWVASFNYLFGMSTHYCNDTKFGMSACFLRVGEDDDDINSEYYGELGYELAYLTKPRIDVIDVAFDEKNKLIE